MARPVRGLFLFLRSYGNRRPSSPALLCQLNVPYDVTPKGVILLRLLALTVSPKSHIEQWAQVRSRVRLKIQKSERCHSVTLQLMFFHKQFGGNQKLVLRKVRKVWNVQKGSVRRLHLSLRLCSSVPPVTFLWKLSAIAPFADRCST